MGGVERVRVTPQSAATARTRLPNVSRETTCKSYNNNNPHDNNNNNDKPIIPPVTPVQPFIVKYIIPA